MENETRFDVDITEDVYTDDPMNSVIHVYSLTYSELFDVIRAVLEKGVGLAVVVRKEGE